MKRQLENTALNKSRRKVHVTITQVTDQPTIYFVKDFKSVVVRTRAGTFSCLVDNVDDELKQILIQLKRGDFVKILYRFDKKYGTFMNFFDIQPQWQTAECQEEKNEVVVADEDVDDLFDGVLTAT